MGKTDPADRAGQAATRAEEAEARLRELVREANGATGDLQRAIRDARHLIGEELGGQVGERLRGEVATAIGGLAGEIDLAQRQYVAKVQEAFDHLLALLLDTGDSGPELEAALRGYADEVAGRYAAPAGRGAGLQSTTVTVHAASPDGGPVV